MVRYWWCWGSSDGCGGYDSCYNGERVIRSNLIYILLGVSMCEVCSCGGLFVGFSASSL